MCENQEFQRLWKQEIDLTFEDRFFQKRELELNGFIFTKNLTWVQTTWTFTVFSKNPLRSSLTWYATYYMSCDHMYPYHPVNSVKAYRIRRTQYLKRWQSDNFIQKLKIFRRIWTIKNWFIFLGRRFASYLTDFDRLEALEVSDFPAVNKYFMLKKHDGR